jgi:hypothetical protein
MVVQYVNDMHVIAFFYVLSLTGIFVFDQSRCIMKSKILIFLLASVLLFMIGVGTSGFAAKEADKPVGQDIFFVDDPFDPSTYHPEKSISELLPPIEQLNTSTFRMEEWQCYDAPFCYLNFSEVEMVSSQEAWALGQTAILHSDGSPPRFQGLYLPAIAK